MNDEIIRVKKDLESVRVAFKTMSDTQSKTLELLEEVSVSTHAAMIAIIETLEENGLDKTKFMVRLDDLSQKLYPSANTFGAAYSTGLIMMLQDPAARKQLPSSSE